MAEARRPQPGAAPQALPAGARRVTRPASHAAIAVPPVAAVAELDVDTGRAAQRAPRPAAGTVLAKTRGVSPRSSFGLVRAVLFGGFFVLLLVACLDAGEVCGDGACPRGTVCDAIHLRCVTPEQMTSCRNQADGTICPLVQNGQDVPGTCQKGVCLPACGDGRISADEECDGADLDGRSCQSLDQGFRGGTLGCTADCRFETSACGPDRCGDGVINGDETCDGADVGGRRCTDVGFYGGTLGCSADCQRLDVSACQGTCGDGVRTAGEVCDRTDFGALSCTTQGFYGGALGCSADCQHLDVSTCTGTCGDGIKNGGELCDGADVGGLSCQAFGWHAGEIHCRSDCVSVDTTACKEHCGDGIVNGLEQCDGLDRGGETCHSLGASGGHLDCDPFCQIDRTTCAWERWQPDPTAPDVSLIDASGTAWNDVWAVGAAGAIVHYDGLRWNQIRAAGTDRDLWTVWAVDARNVWVGGDEGLLRFDGDAWSRIDLGLPELPHINDVWASGPGDVWLASTSGLLHFNGTSWRDESPSSQPVDAVWGSGPDDVWTLVRDAFPRRGATLYRRHDGTWTQARTGSRGLLFGTGPTDVWTTDAWGMFQRFDGVGWTSTNAPSLPINGWSSVPDEAWATSGPETYQFDGVAWRRHPMRNAMPRTSGWSSTRDIWAFGASPSVVRMDGGVWHPIELHRTTHSVRWATGPNDLWAYGGGPDSSLHHYSHGAWNVVDELAPWRIADIAGAAANDVWVVTEGGPLFHLDDRGWQRIDTGGLHNGKAFVRGPDDVWLADQHQVLHHDGHELRRLAFGGKGSVRTVWASAHDDIWVTTEAGTYHHDGAAWSSPSVPFSPGGLSGTGPDDVWTVPGVTDTGALDGVLAHYDGERWELVDTGTDEPLHDVLALGRSDVWAVGDFGTVLHYDGITWAPFETGTTLPVMRLWAIGSQRYALAEMQIPSAGPQALLRLSHALPALRGGMCPSPRSIYCGMTTVDENGGPGTIDRYCGGRDEPGGEVAYRFRSPISGQVTVTLTPADGDVDLIALAADSDTGACLLDRCLAASQRDGTAAETLTLDVDQNDGRYFVVDGPAGARYTLTVACRKGQ